MQHTKNKVKKVLTMVEQACYNGSMMDTSETYIKMSLKAWGYEELEVGVLFSTQSDRVAVTDRGRWYAFEDLKFIPLKTQDQLQEMAEHKSPQMIANFYGDLYGTQLDRDDLSWEQLWLAFVMKEKYNKVWDGEQWIY